MKSRYRKITTFYTHNFLASAALNALSTAQRAEEKEQDYHCLSVMIFCSFSLEALLNHIGQSSFESWDTIEKGMSPRGKLSLICEHLQFDVDRSKPPFQTFDALFKCRNLFAHGRVTKTVSDAMIDFESGEDFPDDHPKHIRGLTIKVAETAMNDTREIIERLSKKAELEETIHVHSESTTMPLIYDCELKALFEEFASGNLSLPPNRPIIRKMDEAND